MEIESITFERQTSNSSVRNSIKFWLFVVLLVLCFCSPALFIYCCGANKPISERPAITIINTTANSNLVTSTEIKFITTKKHIWNPTA